VVDCPRREEARILEVPEEVAVGVEGVLFGEVEDQACSVVGGGEWVVPAAQVVVRMVQEEGSHGCKDRREVGQEVGAYVQGAGAEASGEV
jgi:hypothetical protein